MKIPPFRIDSRWVIGLEFAFLAGLVMWLAYYTPDGGVSPDSAFYLRAANTLADQHSLFVMQPFDMPYGIAPNTEKDGKILFATWPWGYPALIAGVKTLTATTSWFSSKLVNLLLLGMLSYGFWRRYRSDAPYYVGLLLIHPFIALFYYTWSETCYIVSLVCVVWLLKRFHDHPHWGNGVILAGALIIPFLFRYAGAGVLALLAVPCVLWLVQKNWSALIKAVLIGLLAATLIGLYLVINYYYTGHPTGQARPFSAESNGILVMQLAHGVIETTHFPALCLTVGLICILMIRKRRAVFSASASQRAGITIPDWVWYGLAAFISGGLIVLLRWHVRFDPFGPRLLAPSYFLLLLSVLHFLLLRNINRKFLAALLGVAIIISLPRLPATHAQRYDGSMQAQQSLYGTMTPGSIVLTDTFNSYFLAEKVFPYPSNLFSYRMQIKQWTMPQVLNAFCANPYVNAIYLDRDYMGILSFLQPVPEPERFKESAMIQLRDCRVQEDVPQ